MTTQLRIPARVLALTALVALAGLAPVAMAGADDLPSGSTLPALDQVVGFQAAANSTIAAFPGAIVTRVKFEFENGQLIYRTEGVQPVRKARVRQDINPFTGAVLRSRSQNLGGRDGREASTLQTAFATFTVDFSQAGQIAVRSRGAGQASDVRIEGTGRGLIYKVTVLNGTAKSEVRIDPITGAVLGTSTKDNRNDSGNNNGNNSGNNNGNNNGGGGAIGNGANAIANAITNALANQPAGTLVFEADLERGRGGTKLEVKTIAPDATSAIEFRANPGTGAIIRSESESVPASEANKIAAFRTALGTNTPITYANAMALAVAARAGDVSEIEIGVLGGQPFFEVKVQQGARSRSVKVNAITGAIL